MSCLPPLSSSSMTSENEADQAEDFVDRFYLDAEDDSASSTSDLHSINEQEDMDLYDLYDIDDVLELPPTPHDVFTPPFDKTPLFTDNTLDDADLLQINRELSQFLHLSTGGYRPSNTKRRPQNEKIHNNAEAEESDSSLSPRSPPNRDFERERGRLVFDVVVEEVEDS